MSFTPPFKYINADELTALIKSGKTPNKDYLVVDVRDEDFVGGNIKHAVNSPSEQFEDDVHNLVEKTTHIPVVIFHCALSQQRGPKAARIYAETRNALQKEGKDGSHDVLVLRGGFTEFQMKNHEDADLVENWDKRVWHWRLD